MKLFVGLLITGVLVGGVLTRNVIVNYNNIYPNNPFSFRIKLGLDRMDWIMSNGRRQKKVANKILEQRLREIEWAVADDQPIYISASLSRYITFAGRVMARMEPRINGKLIEGHSLRLEKVRDNNPAQSALWIESEQARDTALRLESY